MMISRRLIAALSAPSALLTIVAIAVVAVLASDRAHADEDGSFIGVITADNVFVRSGPADSYYPIGRASKGDLVKVVGERFGWVRIHTTGPTFADEKFFGYIIYPKTQPGRFRLGEDGQSGRTLGRTDVLGPNLNSDFDPNDSWKPLIRLEANTTVRVLETLDSANNLVQKIKLPEQAEVWISARFVDRADRAQRAAWTEYFEPEKSPRRTASERDREQPDKKPKPKASEAEREKAEAAEAKKNREEQPSQTVLGREEQPVPDVEPLDDEASEPDEEPAEPEDDESDVQEEAADESERDDPEKAESTTAQRLAEVTIDDLEAALEQLRNDPIETAEVTPLRRMYLDFAERADNDRNRHFAIQRAEQLELWAEIQQNRQRLSRLRSRAAVTGERVEAARRAVDDAGDYTAVGRLSVSTIYDGMRLPELLRLQEPGTGRTVAYVQPLAEFNLAGMLGQLIGIVGEKEYDGGLRLNIIQPRRVDILAPRD